MNPTLRRLPEESCQSHCGPTTPFKFACDVVRPPTSDACAPVNKPHGSFKNLSALSGFVTLGAPCAGRLPVVSDDEPLPVAGDGFPVFVSEQPETTSATLASTAATDPDLTLVLSLRS